MLSFSPNYKHLQTKNWRSCCNSKKYDGKERERGRRGGRGKEKRERGKRGAIEGKRGRGDTYLLLCL
jgi:hypothetical protein